MWQLRALCSMHVVEFGPKTWSYHGKEIKEEVKGEKMGNKQKNSRNWTTELPWENCPWFWWENGYGYVSILHIDQKEKEGVHSGVPSDLQKGKYFHIYCPLCCTRNQLCYTNVFQVALSAKA